MDQFVLKSISLQNERPKDTSLIVPVITRSPIQPLKDTVKVDEILESDAMKRFFPSVKRKSDGNNKIEEPSEVTKSVARTALSNFMGNIDNMPVKKDIVVETVHPFLGCNKSVDNSKLICKLEDLDDKKVDYKDILLKNGISQNAPLKYVIDFNLLTDLQNKSETKNETKVESNPHLAINVDNFEIPQHWSLMDIVNKNPPNSWIQVFKECYKELERISEFLSDKEKNGIVVYPLKKDIFRALMLTPLDTVKLVILGQDPFPGTDRSTGRPIANGLAFSSNGGEVPQSTQNIYKILQKTVIGFVTPNHSDLSGWAKQGVLLINTCLTLDEGSSASHKGLWSEFITRVINIIDKTNPNCVYLLWGNHAQQYANIITSKHKLMTSHPSNQGFRFGFNESNHFNEANEILKNLGKEPINWNLTN